LQACDYIIVPGVGHFADCWTGLSAIDGMVEALGEAVLEKGKPFLGICVGMQLLANEGHEGGNTTPGLGWISGKVRHFADCLDGGDMGELKIPHMGWNDLQIKTSGHPVAAALPAAVQMYFVHSYVFDEIDTEHILAITDYGLPVPALIGRDNIVGTQFHPEKSQHAGQAMLDAFLSWQP
jgi:glutamine amidotransferase